MALLLTLLACGGCLEPEPAGRQPLVMQPPVLPTPSALDPEICRPRRLAPDAVPLRLLGTVVNSVAGSSALIADESGGRTRGYGVGARVQGWQVVSIGQGAVTLRSDIGLMVALETGRPPRVRCPSPEPSPGAGARDGES